VLVMWSHRRHNLSEDRGEFEAAQHIMRPAVPIELSYKVSVKRFSV
jgi:hypothetical protein